METPLLSAFNKLHKTIRWCTPSISKAPQVQNIYENDMSISLHDLGNPLTDTGVFGKATKLAAKAYKSDYTLFGVNGSSGANLTVLRALQSLGKRKILASRNTHISIINGCNFFDLDLQFLPLNYNQEWEMVEPNSVEEVVKSVRKHKPDVLLLTSPTYDGLMFDLSKIITQVRNLKKPPIIYIDEAWGAHLPFMKKTTSAMKENADICVQSTHKMGGALQQTAMIHWKKTLPYEVVLKAYQECSTTSPSFHLLASLDANRAYLQAVGEDRLDELQDLATAFFECLLFLPHVVGFSRMSDPLKITIKLDRIQAWKIAKKLEENGIITEKYGMYTLLFVVGFQNTAKDVFKTVKILKDILSSSKPRNMIYSPLPDTKNGIKHGDRVKSVSWKRAIDKVCAEIIPYPPGITLLSKGDVITKEHINYLKQVQKNNTTILMKSKNTIDVFI